MNLYTTHAKKFSDTRKSPWTGWAKVLEFITKNLKLKTFLDLGCGNGRFLKFLLDNNISIEKYTGLDNSQILLNIAKKQIQEVMKSRSHEDILSDFPSSRLPVFLKTDLEDPNWASTNKLILNSYNLIVAFGLMHHLKTPDSRRKLYENSVKLLKKDGYLVLTFWQFAKLERYRKKLASSSQQLAISKKLEAKSLKLEANDYILSFGTNGATRFCHDYTDVEIKKLEEGLDLKRIDTYYSDGRENNENLYVVYTKVL